MRRPTYRVLDFERDVRRLLFLATMLLEEHTILVIEEPRGAVGDSKFEKQFDQVHDRQSQCESHYYAKN